MPSSFTIYHLVFRSPIADRHIADRHFADRRSPIADRGHQPRGGAWLNGFTYIFISHDLSVVKHMSDKVVVLYNGKIVEYEDADSLFEKPKDSYTKKLIKASM